MYAKDNELAKKSKWRLIKIIWSFFRENELTSISSNSSKLTNFREIEDFLRNQSSDYKIFREIVFTLRFESRTKLEANHHSPIEIGMQQKYVFSVISP